MRFYILKALLKVKQGHFETAILVLHILLKYGQILVLLSRIIYDLTLSQRRSSWWSAREGLAVRNAKGVLSFLSYYNYSDPWTNPRPPALQSSTLPTELILLIF